MTDPKRYCGTCAHYCLEKEYFEGLAWAHSICDVKDRMYAIISPACKFWAPAASDELERRGLEWLRWIDEILDVTGT